MNLLCKIGWHTKWRYIPFVRPKPNMTSTERLAHIAEFAGKCIWWQFCTICGAQRMHYGPLFGWIKKPHLSAEELQRYNRHPNVV